MLLWYFESSSIKKTTWFSFVLLSKLNKFTEFSVTPYKKIELAEWLKFFLEIYEMKASLEIMTIIKNDNDWNNIICLLSILNSMISRNIKFRTKYTKKA